MERVWYLDEDDKKARSGKSTFGPGRQHVVVDSTPPHSTMMLDCYYLKRPLSSTQKSHMLVLSWSNLAEGG